MGADFCSADGAFEDAGDFGEREFLESGEQQDFAIVVVQAIATTTTLKCSVAVTMGGDTIKYGCQGAP